MRLLILGGTTEASALAHRIAGRTDLKPILSLAGRTRNRLPSPIPFRVGGFGGIGGLKNYLASTRIDVVIDATHPFAAQMSRHAVVACGDLALPIAVFTRIPWHSQKGDRWTNVDNVASAVRTLGAVGRTVFLTVGGLQLAPFSAAPQHRYIIRAIDPPEAIRSIPSHHLILARGPFGLEDEIALMQQYQVEVLVTKNSGGTATEAKLIAARALRIEVIMVERPLNETLPTFDTIDDILAWIEAHRPVS